MSTPPDHVGMYISYNHRNIGGVSIYVRQARMRQFQVYRGNIMSKDIALVLLRKYDLDHLF